MAQGGMFVWASVTRAAGLAETDLILSEDHDWVFRESGFGPRFRIW
jgi:hypothetical protein